MGGITMNIRLVVESITPLPIPNRSGAVFGPTPGISRNMQGGDTAQLAAVSLGGGNLNGSANTAHLMYQAGTNATRWQMPRKFANPGNWCGIV
jgi:hypothetical protein